MPPETNVTLGEAVGNFPLRFAKAVMFGEGPSREAQSKINSATASLLQLECGPVAVTCRHVLEAYRERLKGGETCLFQIGGCRIDPSTQCISESQEADLAVLALTQEQSGRIVQGGWIGSQFFSPVAWPPKRVAGGEDVVFGGFPGQWQVTLDYDYLEFASHGQGSRVSDVGFVSFICECRREFWVNTSRLRDVDSLANLGGISGGPAFVWRSLHWDFAGVVREYSQDNHVVLIAHGGLIGANGIIDL
jgi:hypothetical protein